MEGWKSVQGWQKRLPESLQSHKTGLKVKKNKKIEKNCQKTLASREEFAYIERRAQVVELVDTLS